MIKLDKDLYTLLTHHLRVQNADISEVLAILANHITMIINELQVLLNKARQRGDTPGDIITALTISVVGIIKCLRADADTKKLIAKQTCDMITGEIKS